MDAPVPQPEAPSSGPTSSGGAGVLRSDGCQLRRLRDLYVRFGDLSQQDYEERDNLLALRAEIEVRQEPRVASSLPIDGIWDAWQTGNQEARRNGTAAAARVGGPGQGQLGAHGGSVMRIQDVRAVLPGAKLDGLDLPIFPKVYELTRSSVGHSRGTSSCWRVGQGTLGRARPCVKRHPGRATYAETLTRPSHAPTRLGYARRTEPSSARVQPGLWATSHT